MAVFLYKLDSFGSLATWGEWLEVWCEMYMHLRQENGEVFCLNVTPSVIQIDERDG